MSFTSAVSPWQSLPQDSQSKITSLAKTISFKRGQPIYREGEKPKGLYCIKKGLVGLVLIGPNSGKEHLVRLFTHGQFFGHRSLFAQELYHGTATALESSHIDFYPKKELLDLFKQDPLMLWPILSVFSRELRMCEVQHVNILENQILPRLAQALLYLKDLHPEHNWTRTEIANFCASTPSTIIKAMAKLEKQKLIRQVGRTIEILDRNKLIKIQELNDVPEHNSARKNMPYSKKVMKGTI